MQASHQETEKKEKPGNNTPMHQEEEGNVVVGQLKPIKHYIHSGGGRI
jgi:hypothetical protein